MASVDVGMKESLITHLKQILQQDDPLPDVGWVSGPHEAPAVFKLGGGAHLKGKNTKRGSVAQPFHTIFSALFN